MHEKGGRDPLRARLDVNGIALNRQTVQFGFREHGIDVQERDPRAVY